MSSAEVFVIIFEGIQSSFIQLFVGWIGSYLKLTKMVGCCFDCSQLFCICSNLDHAYLSFYLELFFSLHIFGKEILSSS